MRHAPLTKIDEVVKAATQTRPAGPPPTAGELVRDRLGTLTPSERRVARALMSTYPIAGLESMPRLAEAAGVTGPTVLRFVRKLGYEGYPDFQRSLREEVQARMESPLTLYGSQMLRPGEPVLDKSLHAFRQALDKTFASVPPAEFRAVVRLLTDERRRAFFTGGRFSQLIAHYLYRQLRMVRKGCALVGDTFDPRVDELIDIGRGDVVCVFDYRRYQADTVAFARRAAAWGAVVILFTDPWLSPAADVADHVLMSHPDSPSPFDSMLGGFALSETVLAAVVARLGERGRLRVEELEGTRQAAESGEGVALVEADDVAIKAGRRRRRGRS